jgi:PilZ domain
MTSQPEQPSDHPRRSPRQKSFLRGLIYFNNRRSSYDCLIRDINPEGARLALSGMVTTPDVLELHIPQKQQTLTAQVAWRNGEEIGVTFAQAESMQKPAEAGDLVQRVFRLEGEIAALKLAFAKLKNSGRDSDIA